MKRKFHHALFNYIGEIKLHIDIVNRCHHPGQCEHDVNECMKLPYVKKQLNKIDPEKLRKELKVYGAWDEVQLSNHNDNLQRILWIAAGDIKEELAQPRH